MVRRQSKAQKVEADFEAAALAAFMDSVSILTDPRRAQGQRYSLPLVVTSALMATVCGADDAEAMALWAEQNASWLESFFELSASGTPSQDVYLRVLAALDPREFRVVFLDWVTLVRHRASKQGLQVAVDGKTSRRSHDRAAERPAVHTVSAWAVDEGIVLGQMHTEDKSNEITAIPELLRLLDLRGATVTIDAMGCQRDIARTIVDRGGEYILAVKDNQPALHNDIVQSFDDALDDSPRTLDRSTPPEVECVEEVDKGHGRVETRRVYVCRDLSQISTKNRWKKLAFIALVERERTDLQTTKTSFERAYYIGSDPHAETKQIAHQIRGHWGIENSCHWVLDMAFNEDQARHRAGNAAKNFTIIRHFALNLLKADTTKKVGIANKRKLAAWSHDYLLHVLTGTAD